ncbi:MAG: hypothetical protein OXC63_00950 [Aestuariivita sp.]|nr:hypothetical protein [Aestuariivita sp.]MCY4347568.1 hypothetical protein [Aestuariivita sp.]
MTKALAMRAARRENPSRRRIPVKFTAESASRPRHAQPTERAASDGTRSMITAAVGRLADGFLEVKD